MTIVVYSDASMKNHKGVGLGWHLQRPTETRIPETIEHDNDYLSGKYTSMEAEILALTRGVKEALRHGETERLELKTDCHPLMEKVERKEPLCDGQYIDALYRLLDKVDEWDIAWVKRADNTLADRQALSGREQNV